MLRGAYINEKESMAEARAKNRLNHHLHHGVAVGQLLFDHL
jgi:hypothetical protein